MKNQILCLIAFSCISSVLCAISGHPSFFDHLDQFGSDYVTENIYERWPVSTSNSNGPLNYTFTTNARYIAGSLNVYYLINVTNPLKHFSFQPPLNGCPGAITTMVTAAAADCHIAMNAGYFDVPTAACLGHLISNGKTIQVEDLPGFSSFGITQDGYYITGHLDKDLAGLSYIQLISGMGWMVRNGTAYASKDNIGYLANFLRASRTAIGHDSKGNLLIATVNGSEFMKQGLTLNEWADLLVYLGFENAINLDGGGSATLVVKGTITNIMDRWCEMVPTPCERPVTSIVCLK